jgi:hypothetical protein
MDLGQVTLANLNLLKIICSVRTEHPESKVESCEEMVEAQKN